MNIQNPPELADVGYWYVVEAVPDPVEGGQTPGNIPGTGWCAWYANGLVAVRCPQPITGIPTSAPDTVDEILAAAGYTGKPYGRVGGG